MVGHIYTAAASVLACMGPHADGSEALHGRYCLEESLQYTTTKDVKMYKILRAFWKRSYWKRLWIVQEIELARTLHILCGHKILTLRDFSTLPWRPDWTEYLACFAPTAMKIAQGKVTEETLWSAVVQHSHHECEALRDHVYGILAVVEQDVEQSALKVD